MTGQPGRVTQTITVGDGSGLPGNCLQAAVASLLNLDLDDVPHFALYPDWLERLIGFGAAHGYSVTYQPLTVPVTFGLAFGQSPRGVFHAVVLRGAELWDPHPCRDGLVSVANYVAWTPKRPASATTRSRKDHAMLNTNGRHQSTEHFAKFFEYGHLSGDLKPVSKACAELAQTMVDNIPDGPELSAGLRKLLEAKDCFVRAALSR
ncbi:hypothetical protein ACIRG5_42400 [Lentzea sp. NPDC102401]|uniref:hypothetical protein n=1 Tax=Lentzea sp. NPDC102401 TaxID=3364128 RepID=UPI003822CA7F